MPISSLVCLFRAGQFVPELRHEIALGWRSPVNAEHVFNHHECLVAHLRGVERAAQGVQVLARVRAARPGVRGLHVAAERDPRIPRRGAQVLLERVLFCDRVPAVRVHGEHQQINQGFKLWLGHAQAFHAPQYGPVTPEVPCASIR